MTDHAPVPATRTATITRPIPVSVLRRPTWFRGWAIAGAALALLNLALIALAVAVVF